MCDELYRVRNIKPCWSFGTGACRRRSTMWIDTYLFRGFSPWTLKHGIVPITCAEAGAECKPIDYPKPDGVLTFDKLSSVFLSNTNHEEDQPCHLTLKDPTRRWR
jgi:electron-transferring-flavoprotein dehydrogenase